MKGLKDEPNGPAPQQGDGVIVQGGQIHAVEQHATRIRPIESRQQIEQRRLADAGFTHDGEVLALPQFEIEAGEDGGAIRRIAFAEIFEPQNGGGGQSPGRGGKCPPGTLAASLEPQAASTPIMALTSRKSRRPNSPYSRPLPDALKPPNGVCMSPDAPFKATWPARMRFPTRRARALSCDHT